MRLIAIFLFLSSSLLSAQAGGGVYGPAQRRSPPSAQAETPGSVEGVVVRAADGTPLKKAEVSLFRVGEGGRPAGAITAADGRFVLNNVAPGRYQLAVSRNGYVRALYGQPAPNMPGTPLTVTPGQALKGITVRLTAGAVITGRIVDEDGEAMPSVRVQAMRWAVRNGARQLVQSGAEMTNDLGEYRIPALAPGRYVVSAIYMRMRRGFYGRMGGNFEADASAATDQAEQRYAPVFYPNVLDPGQAVPVAVRAGEEVPSIDFRLAPMAAVHVRGVLRGATGELLPDVNLRLVLRGGTMYGARRGASTDDHGAFDIDGVTPGSYLLLADAIEPSGRQWLRQEVEVGAGNLELSPVMQPAVELRGQLRLENGADLAGVTPRVMLSPKSAGERGAAAPVQKDLTFQAGDLSGGDYLLRVGGLPQDTYVKSARAGDLDVLRHGLRVQGRVQPLDIVISGAAGLLQGVVLDDQNQALAAARVILIPEQRDRYDLYKTGSSDSTGRYLLRGIAPGSYKLFAFEAVDEGAWLDPDFISAFDDFGQAVSVSASASLSQDLRAIPGMRGAQ